jgi:hypothetical protein
MVEEAGPPGIGGTLCGVSGKWKTGRESEFGDIGPMPELV